MTSKKFVLVVTGVYIADNTGVPSPTVPKTTNVPMTRQIRV